MDKFPTAATVVTSALMLVGIVMTVWIARLVTGFDQTILAIMGGATFTAGLATFLIEMFGWARARSVSSYSPMRESVRRY